MFWNLIVALTIIYYLVAIPLEISFANLDHDNNIFLVGKCVFPINILFVLNTSFYEKGQLVT